MGYMYAPDDYSNIKQMPDITTIQQTVYTKPVQMLKFILLIDQY